MPKPWATLMGAVKYGYKPFYVLRLRGIPVLFSEVGISPHAEGAPTAPTGYTIDASLVIDGSSRTGSVVNEKHFSNGFDLGARLLATPTVRSLMSRPTRETTLTADVDASASVLEVDSARGWDVSPRPTLYYGLSCAGTSWGYTWDSFVSVDRTTYGPGCAYKAGTKVTDKPRRWQGRFGELFVVLLDPLGRTVSGGDILEDACMVFAGFVQERPRKDGNAWAMSSATRCGA